MKVPVAALVLTGLVLTNGCAEDAAPLRLEVEEPGDPGSHAHDPVRRRWEDRVALPSCGSVVRAQGETLRRDAADDVACLRRGLESGNGAELEVERPTIEGDPIRTYYRVTSTGRTEAYTDGTQDSFGTGEWSFVDCANPASVLQVSC